MKSFDTNKIVAGISSLLFALITMQLCYFALNIDFYSYLYTDPIAITLTVLLALPYYIYIKKKFFPSIQKADKMSYYKDLTDQLKDKK